MPISRTGTHKIEGIHHVFLSDADNAWNQQAIKLSRKAYAQEADRIIEMSSRHLGEIENIKEVQFKEFYQSRLARIVANNQADYALQLFSHALRKPFYFAQFRLYQIMNA